MRPIWLARVCIKAMNLASAIRDEDQPIVDGRCGHHVALQRITPKQPAGGDIAGLRGVDALEPSLVLAPKEITPACHIDAIGIKDWHTVDVARPLPAVAQVTMDVR